MVSLSSDMLSLGVPSVGKGIESAAADYFVHTYWSIDPATARDTTSLPLKAGTIGALQFRWYEILQIAHSQATGDSPVALYLKF